MTIWGNHSATQYPDLFHAEVDGQPAFEVDRATRPGSRATSSRPCSSAARRSSRPVGSRRRRRPPTPPSTTCASGSLGTAGGRLGVDGHPSATAATACPRASSRRSRAPAKDGEYEIVQGLDIDDFSPGPDRRQRRRARRGARRRRGARPHLTAQRLAAPGLADYFRNLLVVLSASTLPPVWQVAQ